MDTKLQGWFVPFWNKGLRMESGFAGIHVSTVIAAILSGRALAQSGPGPGSRIYGQGQPAAFIDFDTHNFIGTKSGATHQYCLCALGGTSSCSNTTITVF